MSVNLNKRILIFSLGLIMALTVWLPVAEASIVSWQEIKNDKPQQLIMVLRLTTDQGRENAWGGQINFDSDQLKLQSISDAQSLVSLWLERPAETKTGQINFSGITPGGFSGSGEMIRLIFAVTGSASSVHTSLRLTDFKALLGDGSGQITKVTISSQISIIDDDSALTDFSLDKMAPDLTWYLTRENLISTGWQLSAMAFDKQSGINYLALATTSNYFGPWGNLAKHNSKLNWQKLTGPQVLANRDLRHIIFLKAVDNAGNVKLIKLYPFRAYSFAVICTIIIGLISFLFL